MMDSKDSLEIDDPLELEYLIEEWMLQNKIHGAYDFDNLKLSMSNLTWINIVCKSDPSKKVMANKKTCVLARKPSSLLVGEPECKVQLYSGMLKYGSTDFNKKINLPFDNLPDYILNYLSMRSLKLDLGSEVTQTEPSPNLVNPQPNQQVPGVAGPVWKGCYHCKFSLTANLNGDVKIIGDDGSVQEENFMEIVHDLGLSNKTYYLLLVPEGCEWRVTGCCKFSLYS